MSKIKETLINELENPCEYEIWQATKDIVISKPKTLVNLLIEDLNNWDGIPCDLL
jgi:hypothetical protein